MTLLLVLALLLVPPAQVQTCQYQGMLPDSSCTPGAVDPQVTQDNIHETICVAGYTARVRPSASYTTRLKRQQMALYGIADQPLSSVEEDHLVSLELAGDPTAPENLWPEPIADARMKDQLENRLHQLACDEQLTLEDAQQMLATDWVAAYRTYIDPDGP